MAVKRKRINWGTWIVLLVIIGGAAGGAIWYRSKSKEQPVQLKTAQVNRGDIVQAVTANGALSPVKNVQVGSQVSGIIKQIYADFNSRVTNGQIIAKIDPSTYEQNIMSANAELANAQAALEYAQLNFKRAKELRAAELVSPSDFDKTVVDLHQAEAVVQTRQAALKRAEVDLERTTIFAPVDGVVISRNVDDGQTVAASFNTPTLFQIANDLRNMRIEAMVSEADVGGVEEGQPVTFTVDAFPGRQFRGQVSQVRFAPITNQNVVSYTSVVDVNNADLKLRPGMTATASIVTGEKKGVLRIPNAALRFRPPEDLLAKSAKTNAPASGGGTNTMVAQGSPRTPAGGASGGGEGGERPNREEMRRRFESMTPEEREQKRQRFRERGGGGGGFGGGGGSGGGRRPEGPVTRTIYVVDTTASKPGKPIVKPITIKTGIADNSFTEVIEGINENDEVVTGLNTPTIAASSQVPQGRSPFGGGGGFGGGGRGPR
jgi:HlyD family secretion protein